MQYLRSASFLLLNFVLLLPACTATKDSRVQKIQSPNVAARPLLAQGDYLGAAQQYLNAIAHANKPQTKDRYRIQAIEYLIKANRIRTADAQLRQLHSNDAAIQARQQIAYAEIQIAQGNNAGAVERLTQLSLDKIPLSARVRYHQLFQFVLEQEGHEIAAIYQRLYLDPNLKGTERQDNQKAIWQGLQKLNEQQLRNMPTPAPNTLTAWLSLVLALREHRGQDVSSLWQRWQQMFPNHSLDLNLIQALYHQGGSRTGQARIARNNTYNQQHIAVFLPQNPRFKKIANKVQDGLLSAWYETDVNQRPLLSFYDANPETIAADYQKAVDAGAQIAIGPLGKKAAATLNQAYQRLPIATVFLSPDPNLHHKHNAFQLSLSTSQEAELVADKMLLDGSQRAAVIAPDNAWGQQALEAFSARYESRGGSIVDYALYGKNYDRPVKQVIRAAPDSVFIVAKSLAGRQLVPRFRYYKGGGIRLYANSQIYAGNVNQRRDQDLNGVRFADLPWVLLQRDWKPELLLSQENGQTSPSRGLINSAQAAENPSIAHNTDDGLYQQLKQHWSGAMHSNGRRLLALGADAFRVLDYLYSPEAYPDGFGGATGLLKLNQQGVLSRQLPWGQFRGGTAKVIAK